MNPAPVLLVAALGAFVARTPSGSGGPPAGLAFETIVHEVTSGLHERRREVVHDEEGWARLWAQIHEGVTPQPPVPPVDFSRDMLIAVATGTRPTGGFDIKVRSVVRRGDRLEVVVLETCPAAGARVSMGLTQPVEVVRVALFAQPPAFQETRTPSCR